MAARATFPHPAGFELAAELFLVRKKGDIDEPANACVRLVVDGHCRSGSAGGKLIQPL
jgi:hypothetical protein